MRMFALSLAAGLAVFSASAFAQAHDHNTHGGAAAAMSVQTTPADGDMGASPAIFRAAFDHPMRLTSFVITPRGGDPIAVTIPAGAPAASATVALPALSPGNYVFAWTAIGADNHTMTGRVRYMVH